MDCWINQKVPRDKWQWKDDDPKPMGCSKCSSKREVYSSAILPQETWKTANKQPNLTHKATRKKSEQNPKLVEGKKSEKSSRNKWNWDEENKSKDQWK